MNPVLAQLRQKLDRLVSAADADRVEAERIGLGASDIDAVLGGGLVRGHLHEAYARKPTDGVALAGFALGLARRAGASEMPIVWVRHPVAELDFGSPYGPGLEAWGLDPDRLILVRARTLAGLLAAGLEAVRCPGLGAVLIEVWGPAEKLDLTATRRLNLAAETSRTTPFLLRAAASPVPSAALTRWQVAAAPSRALAANAPGPPRFDVALLRNRAGPTGQNWRLEWDHDNHRFNAVTPLSGDLHAVPQRRPAGLSGANDGPDIARTG